MAELSNHIDAGTSASRLETGISRTRNANIIGLELHLGDFKSRTLIPGMDSANEVAIGSGGQGLDLAGAIGKTGWKFNVGRDYSQGTGSAIRTLVELAMIELTGKWARRARKAVKANGWGEPGISWTPGVDRDPFGHDDDPPEEERVD